RGGDAGRKIVVIAGVSPTNRKMRPTQPPLQLQCSRTLEFWQEGSFRRRARSQPPQILEAVNPSVVAIVPARLQCVTAHDDETVELKAGVGMTDLRSQNISEHIRFATASCARTGATEQLKDEIRFA